MTKKAAIYLRVSSIDQNYERQEIELKALAKCLGYEVKYIFEEKRSAVLKMDTRDELTQMRKLTKNEIDRIFIWDITRLSRRAIDFITLINEFTDKGICLHFKDKNIITLDEDGKQDMFVSMYLYILGLFAQMDAENLKAKMRSGRERGLAIGHAYTGCAPYGYKLINKQLYIDEKEAETVRAIFNNYVDGKSIQHIIDILNSNKIPTRTGILWTRNSIYAIITNPVYKGKPELTSITKRDENKKPLEKITRVFKAPVIIESPIWDEAQVQRKKHKSFIDKSKEREALLRGILQCGNCGKAYCTAINGSGVPTYICSDNRANINQKLNCKNGGVACYFLDSICWQTIKDIYAYKNFQDTFTKEKAKNQQLLQENQTQINNFIDKQIELDKENERVNKGYRIGIYTDSEAIRAKGEINNNKARYEKMIEELKAQNSILTAKIKQDFSHYKIPTVELSYEEKKAVCKELIETAKIYSYPPNNRIVQLQLKMGLIFNIVLNPKRRLYYIIDNSSVTFNNPQSAPIFLREELKDKDFTVTCDNNDCFNEEIFGEYSFAQMWNIMDKYGYIQDYPKVKK